MRYIPTCHADSLVRRGWLNRRSWPEITIDILDVTSTPSNKMRIMYKSNLNFERFNKYFNNLLKKGLMLFYRGDNILKKFLEKRSMVTSKLI